MSGEGMSTDRAPFFDGTGFPRWKVLMQAHLQARGLDVWRVTEEGKKNENKAERQYDAIAKSILLSSLCDSVFNRVFANENAHKLWKQIVENHEGTKKRVECPSLCWQCWLELDQLGQWLRSAKATLLRGFTLFL